MLGSLGVKVQAEEEKPAAGSQCFGEGEGEQSLGFRLQM